MIETCTHCADFTTEGAKFQNERYGHGKRVMCPCGTIHAKGEQKVRCTVCATVSTKQVK